MLRFILLNHGEELLISYELNKARKTTPGTGQLSLNGGEYQKVAGSSCSTLFLAFSRSDFSFSSSFSSGAVKIAFSAFR